ncbi:MAG: class I SAM-dependent methyltransferase [Desulfobacterales bacterium]
MPRVTHFLCSAKQVRRQREKIVPLAEGRVLEVGIGSGLNLPLYTAGKVQHLWGLDPSTELWAMSKPAVAQVEFDVEFIGAAAEEIPLEDNSADTVLVTYTLCSLAKILPALGEMRRVLRQSGRLVFCEHGAAPDEGVRHWQNRLNPIWKRIAGGCNLNLPIPSVLESAGFKIREMDTMYIPGWKPACFNYWGTAISS